MNSLLRMRPFQIIVMLVFVIMAFVGLFLFANYSGSKGAANKIGTVVIWGTLPRAGIQAELDKIVGANKGYANVSYVQKPAATFDTDLANALASQDGPDLILINQEQLVNEVNKINLLQYSNTLTRRSFVDTTYLPEFSLYSNNNGTYGIPYVLDPLVLYYNKSLLGGAGVTTPPTSWEAVRGLASLLSKSNGTDLTQSTIPFGTYTNVTNGRAILSLLFLQSSVSVTQTTANGVRSTIADNTAQTGSTPAASVVNFYTQFSDPSRTVYSWNSSFGSDRQQFLAGDLALYVGFASELPVLSAANPNLNFDMATIPQPQTATSQADYGLAYAFAIPKGSKNPNGALAAAFALADKNFETYGASALSMAPAQRALLVSSPNDIYTPVFYPLALISQGWLSPAPAATDAIFSAMITNVTSGRLDVPTALATAAQALDAALNQ